MSKVNSIDSIQEIIEFFFLAHTIEISKLINHLNYSDDHIEIRINNPK